MIRGNKIWRNVSLDKEVSLLSKYKTVLYSSDFFHLLLFMSPESCSLITVATSSSRLFILSSEDVYIKIIFLLMPIKRGVPFQWMLRWKNQQTIDEYIWLLFLNLFQCSFQLKHEMRSSLSFSSSRNQLHQNSLRASERNDQTQESLCLYFFCIFFSSVSSLSLSFSFL